MSFHADCWDAAETLKDPNYAQHIQNSDKFTIDYDGDMATVKSKKEVVKRNKKVGMHGDYQAEIYFFKDPNVCNGFARTQVVSFIPYVNEKSAIYLYKAIHGF